MKHPTALLVITVVLGVAPAQRPLPEGRISASESAAWVPSEDLLQRAEGVRGAGGREAALALLEPMPPAERVTILRAGLRHPDAAVARACAAHLEWQWLDAWEMDRAVALLAPEIFEPAGNLDFAMWCDCAGSVDLPLILGRPAPWTLKEGFTPGDVIGSLHRMVRAEHVPLLCRLAASDDRTVADTAFGELGPTTLVFTDRHREAVAAMLFTRLHRERSAERTSGMPAALRGVAAAWLETRSVDAWRGTFDWLCRWLLDCRPDDEDLPLLTRLWDATSRPDFRDAEMALGALLRAAGRIGSPAAIAWLEERRGPSTDTEAVRVAALASARPAMLEELASLAASEPVALTLLVERWPGRARGVLRAAVLEAPFDDAMDALDDLEVTVDWRAAWRSEWAEDALADLEPDVLAARADGLVIARLGAMIPALRTRAVAAAAIAALDPETLTAIDHAPTRAAFAFLETAAGDLLRARLKELLPAPGADPDTESEAVQRARSFAAAPADPRKADLAGLAASLDDVELDEEPAARVRELLEAGRVIDALLAVFEAKPDARVRNAGVAADPRVVDHLRAIRSRRELGLYAWATDELVLAGDPAAREEMWSLVKAGRYRSCHDAASERALSLNRDPATAPFWIDELESNCCRAVVAKVVLDLVFGLDLRSRPWDGGETAAATARRWWKDARGRLVWSAQLGRFVPAPRR